MKFKILLFLILIAVPSVFASTPDFTRTDLIESQVNNGENDIGDLLFVSAPYIPEVHIRSTIEPMNFQQYDVMRWMGENSVTIKNPILVETTIIPSSEYKFNINGIYYINSILNTSDIATIIINRTDDNRVFIDNIVEPDGFELNFSSYDFIIPESGEKHINLNLTVDDDVEFGNYQIKYDINDIEQIKNIEVLKTINWTINLTDFNQTEKLKSGETKYIGKIIIENIGNTEIEIITTKEGNFSNYIGIPNPRTLFKKNTMQLDFEVNVPTIAKSGFYTVDLVLDGNGGKIQELIPLNFTIVDSIDPVIENITFSLDKAFLDNKVSVFTNDNNEVANVSLEFDGEEIWFKKDKNLFTETISFDKLSRYVMKFCAYDLAENEKCEIINKTFTQIDVVTEYEESIKLPSKKFGEYSKIKLFNISDTIDGDISLRLINIEVSEQDDNKTTPIVRVVNDKNSIKTFSKYDSEIILDKQGEYFLEVRADYETSITGLVRLELPEHYTEVEDITFKVEFKDYNVPDDFTKVFGDTEMKCKVYDKGDLDESYIDCSRRLPINTRPEDISVPMTVSEKDKIESEVDNKEDELNKSKAKMGWTIAIILFMFLILIFWSLYKVYWSPYICFTLGKSKKNK